MQVQLQDIDIRSFKEDIIRIVNTNPLPLEVKRLVVKEVSDMVSEAADEVIQQQKIARQQQAENPGEEKPTEEGKENEEPEE